MILPWYQDWLRWCWWCKKLELMNEWGDGWLVRRDGGRGGGGGGGCEGWDLKRDGSEQGRDEGGKKREGRYGWGRWWSLHKTKFTITENLFFLSKLKGTVAVITSDLPFIEWHVRFTAIPFKPLSDQEFNRYSYLFGGKLSANWNRANVHQHRVYSVTCYMYNK